MRRSSSSRRRSRNLAEPLARHLRDIDWYNREEANRTKRMNNDRAKAKRSLKLTEEEQKQTGLKRLWPITDVAPWDYSDWKAIKFLGSGGNGLVSLWEFQGTELDDKDLQHGTKIALKTAQRDTQHHWALRKEADTMLKLAERQSQHLVKCLVYREPGALYLEYVAGGDMWQELKRRKKTTPPEAYTEVALWRMFLCFAKGMEAMGMCDKEKMWWPWLHLDYKPDNIFLGQDDNHDCAGSDILYKVADFGWAAELKDYRENWQPSEQFRQSNYRRAGNENFRTPEQICQDWTKNNWQESEICGNWTPQLNIWAVGATMWQMAMLEYYPPSVFSRKESEAGRNPYMNKYISGLDPKLAHSHTFGKTLEGSSYSKELKVMILRCLMEVPKHRPAPDELVREIQSHLRETVDGFTVNAQSSEGTLRVFARRQPGGVVRRGVRKLTGRVRKSANSLSLKSMKTTVLGRTRLRTSGSTSRESLAIATVPGQMEISRQKVEETWYQMPVSEHARIDVQWKRDLGQMAQETARKEDEENTRQLNLAIQNQDRETEQNIRTATARREVERDKTDEAKIIEQQIEELTIREAERAVRRRGATTEAMRWGPSLASIAEQRRIAQEKRSQFLQTRQRTMAVGASRGYEREHQDVHPLFAATPANRQPVAQEIFNPQPTIASGSQPQPNQQMAVTRLFPQDKLVTGITPNSEVYYHTKAGESQQEPPAETSPETTVTLNTSIVPAKISSKTTVESSSSSSAGAIIAMERQKRDDAFRLLLPFVAYTDITTGRPYFYNPETGNTRWTPPAPEETLVGRLESSPRTGTPIQNRESSPHLKLYYPWERMRRPDGKVYYYNWVTEEVKKTFPNTLSGTRRARTPTTPRGSSPYTILR